MPISQRHGLVRWTVAAGVLVALLLVGLLSFSASALALPEGRVYELVSPPYKGGFGAKGIEAVAPDGESVSFFSAGAFAGAPASAESLGYVARRGADEWSTAPMMTPVALLAKSENSDVSSTLGLRLTLGEPGRSNAAAELEGTEEEFLLHDTSLPDIAPEAPDPGPDWELGGMALKTLTEGPLILRYEGGNADLCHLLFRVVGSVGNAGLLPEAGVEKGAEIGKGPENLLYELVRGCNGEQVSLRLVGVRNADGPHGEPEPLSTGCYTDLGFQNYGAPRSALNAVSVDGESVFFTTCIDGNKSSGQLFVRLGGSKTIEVSRPLAEKCEEVPCGGAAKRAGASFVGASEDGSRVFFMSRQPLMPGDTDVSNNLYLAGIDCAEDNPGCGVGEREVVSLRRVSAGVSGESAEVQGVVRVAADGSRVYFVARGVLGEGGNGEGGAPVKGADNLYVYDSATDKVGFIADLCSGRESSGAVGDGRCPSLTGSDASLWDDSGGLGGGEAQANSCPLAGAGCEPGRFLVFSTYAQLGSGDTDNARDVYRYDAATERLERVSVGEAGFDADGNGGDGSDGEGSDATILPGHWGGSVRNQYEMDNRAVSEDGSRIVFTSSEPLSEHATNGLENAYEWHAGDVSLVSTGSSDEAVSDVVISASGSDVFFVTDQGLVAQDTDGQDDVYDARLGRGFPRAAVPAEPCEGEACYGPLTNPAPLLVPGSVSQAPGGNFTAPATVPAAVVKKAKPKSKTARCRRGYVKKQARCVRKPVAGRAGVSDRRVK
jgi:hypothetical protein